MLSTDLELIACRATYNTQTAIEQALLAAFEATNRDFLHIAKAANLSDGATALIAVTHGALSMHPS